MAKRKDGQPRGQCMMELMLEAVRLVRGGQAAVTAKVLGMPKQTLENWLKLDEKGQLKDGAGDKSVSTEQMEPARLLAENARFSSCSIYGYGSHYLCTATIIE